MLNRVTTGSNCMTIKKGAIRSIYYFFQRCRNIVERLINGAQIGPNFGRNNNTHKKKEQKRNVAQIKM